MITDSVYCGSYQPVSYTHLDVYKRQDDIGRIMRTLFSLSITSENRELILTAFSKIANEKIQGARRIELQRRIEKQNMIPYVLFLWLGFVILNMIASIRFF